MMMCFETEMDFMKRRWVFCRGDGSYKEERSFMKRKGVKWRDKGRGEGFYVG